MSRWLSLFLEKKEKKEAGSYNQIQVAITAMPAAFCVVESQLSEKPHPHQYEGFGMFGLTVSPMKAIKRVSGLMLHGKCVQTIAQLSDSVLLFRIKG